MNTIIIDNSLASKRAQLESGTEELEPYAEGLEKMGVKYCEISYDVYRDNREYLDLSKCILRIRHENELDALKSDSFAYITLPFRFVEKIPEISARVILEVPYADDIDALKLFTYLRICAPVEKLAMLRFSGVFDFNAKEFRSFVDEYRSRFTTPLDICPLNTKLTGITQAIYVYAAKPDSLTLRYGEDAYYTPSEGFLITLASLYKAIPFKDYLSGICQAAVYRMIMFGSDSRTLSELVTRYRFSSRKIENADSEEVNMSRPHAYIDNERTDIYFKRFTELGIDEDGLISELEKVLDKCSPRIGDSDYEMKYTNADRKPFLM